MTPSQVSSIGITRSGNNLTVNGDTVTSVYSVSGSVINNNLRVSVNGVQSSDIPLPESSIKTITINPFTINSPMSDGYITRNTGQPRINVVTNRDIKCLVNDDNTIINLENCTPIGTISTSFFNYQECSVSYVNYNEQIIEFWNKTPLINLPNGTYMVYYVANANSDDYRSYGISEIEVNNGQIIENNSQLKLGFVVTGVVINSVTISVIEIHDS